MAAILLPPTFLNSFWSQDHFRHGLTVLFDNLESGLIENAEIITFIQSQATAYLTTARALSSTPSASSFTTSGFSLHQSFLTLQELSTDRQAEAYGTTGYELERQVLDEFRKWCQTHSSRVRYAREEMVGVVDPRTGKILEKEESLVGTYEEMATKVSKLKQTYLGKARLLDDMEEDARFAPTNLTNSAGSHAKRTSVQLLPTTMRADREQGPARPTSISAIPSHVPSSPQAVKRSGTVAERIAEKLKATQAVTSSTANVPVISEKDSVTRHTRSSSLDAPPEMFHFSGVLIPFEALISLLTRFAHHLASTLPPSESTNDEIESRTRTTILGTYDETFSGTELVDWLCENVSGFNGERARAMEAGSELLQWNLISRIGVGRGWDTSGEAHYVLKESATDTSPYAIEALRNHLREKERVAESLAAPSPVTTTDPTYSAFNQASSLVKNYLPSAISRTVAREEPQIVRLRRETKLADDEYKAAVEQLDHVRLRMEERISAGLRSWERWERERLAAVKAVLRQFEAVIARLPEKIAAYNISAKTAIDAFQPEADLVAMIESNRTGDFRPTPHIYESWGSFQTDSCFGVDLRKWSGQQSWKAVMKGGESHKTTANDIPVVLDALLQSIKEKEQEGVSNDERRKAWIYIVGLKELHQLRERVNDPHIPKNAMIAEAKQFNLPVIAATTKLWLLELNPPILNGETFTAFKEYYGKPDTKRDSSEIVNVLSHLAGPQIFVLDAIVGHLRQLIDSTKTEEADDVFITKLGLSLGRAIMRTEDEGAVSLRDHTASRLLSDLILNYSTIFPELVQKAKRILDRPMPLRKRTRPVDERTVRSRLPSGQEHRQSESSSSTEITTSPLQEQTTPLPLNGESTDALGTEGKQLPPIQSPVTEHKNEGEDERPPTFAAPILTKPPTPPLAPAPVAKDTAVISPMVAPIVTEPRPVEVDKSAETQEDEDDVPPSFALPILPSSIVPKEQSSPTGMERAASQDDKSLVNVDATLRRSGSGETTGRVVRGPRGEADTLCFERDSA